MKKKLIIPPVQIKQSNLHGYGVFATRDIQQDELIEECHTLIFEGSSHEITARELLSYVFAWREKPSASALPLGYGSIYNHSKEHNATWHVDYDCKIIRFKALRNIKEGEEITVNYGAEWFNERGLKPRRTQFIPRQYRSLAKMLFRFTLIITTMVTAKFLIPH